MKIVIGLFLVLSISMSSTRCIRAYLGEHEQVPQEAFIQVFRCQVLLIWNQGMFS